VAAGHGLDGAAIGFSVERAFDGDSSLGAENLYNVERDADIGGSGGVWRTLDNGIEFNYGKNFSLD